MPFLSVSGYFVQTKLKFVFFSGAEGLLEQAAKWEASGEHEKAIDAYCKVVPSSSTDANTAIKCWVKVIQL